MTQVLLLQMPNGAEWLIVVFIILAALFWLKTLVELIGNRSLDTSSKIAWLIVVLFLGFIGAVIYLFFGKKTKHVTSGFSN